MKADIFQSGGHCWIFQICWHIECSTSTASPFRIWNRSVGIPLPLLALFIVMLPKAHLTLHPRISSSRSVASPLWLSRSLRSFLYQFSSVPLSVWFFVTTWTAACQASLSIHQLPELAQTHVHWVSDDIQPSHPLSFSSPPAFNLSQHQGLFKWVSSPHQEAKLLEFQLQHQCFQWIFGTEFL